MSDKPDEFDAKAAELLPCRNAPGTCLEPSRNWHSLDCPAKHRPAVAAALRKEHQRGFREGVEAAAKVADDAREDEEYGHAAFRCVQIAQGIRALAPDVEEKL